MSRACYDCAQAGAFWEALDQRPAALEWTSTHPVGELRAQVRSMREPWGSGVWLLLQCSHGLMSEGKRTLLPTNHCPPHLSPVLPGCPARVQRPRAVAAPILREPQQRRAPVSVGSLGAAPAGWRHVAARRLYRRADAYDASRRQDQEGSIGRQPQERRRSWGAASHQGPLLCSAPAASPEPAAARARDCSVWGRPRGLTASVHCWVCRRCRR